MAQHRVDQAYEIVWLIRRLFRAMAAEADRYLAGTEISAADRAVMEFLYPRRALSVPEIARRYNVSRQHVQVTVNALLGKGLLTGLANPQHKRSQLMCLSDLGRECFAEIRRQESVIVKRVFADVSDDALETTHVTLNALLQQLQQKEER